MTTDRPHRYLFATVPAAGHVHPAVPVARELLARGHEVRWLTGTAFRSLVESTGAAFEPLVETYDPADGSTITERFPERAGLTGLAGIKFDIKHVFIDQIPAQAADLRRVLATYDADVVVADTGFMGASVQHELGGPRWASISVTPLAIPSRDTAPFGTGLPPIRTRRDRLRSAVLSLSQRTVMRDVERHHTAVRAGLGLPASAHGILQANASPYLFLQSGTRALDYPRSDLPDQVHYVGPLVMTGSPSQTSTDWAALAAGRPVVLVTQGTVATESDGLVDTALRALADRDVFVVALGAAPTGAVPDNARVQDYVPYDEVLRHASAMITNGGYGGVQLALSHAVPLAVAGATEDKPEVAARVAWSGAGLDLRTATPSEQDLRAAVTRLLTDVQIRSAAQRIAEEYARHDAPRTSADLLEAMVGSGRAAGRSQMSARDQVLR